MPISERCGRGLPQPSRIGQSSGSEHADTPAGDGVKLMNYMALMGAGVALVVGAFLVYTTMTMAITQRRLVISMLRAIGGRRIMIVRDLLAEAVILGLIGGAIGSGIGIVMGRAAIGRLPPAITQGLEARVDYWLPAMRYRWHWQRRSSPLWRHRRWRPGRCTRFHRSEALATALVF